MHITVSLSTTSASAEWLLANLPAAMADVTAMDPNGQWTYRRSARSDRVVLVTRQGPPLPRTPAQTFARVIIDRVCELFASHPERAAMLEERDVIPGTYRVVD